MSIIASIISFDLNNNILFIISILLFALLLCVLVVLVLHHSSSNNVNAENPNITRFFDDVIIIQSILQANDICEWNYINNSKPEISQECLKMFEIHNLDNPKEDKKYKFILNQLSLIYNDLKESESNSHYTEFNIDDSTKGLRTFASFSTRINTGVEYNIYGVFFDISSQKNKELWIEKNISDINSWIENNKIPIVDFKPVYDSSRILVDLLFNHSNNSFNNLFGIVNKKIKSSSYSEYPILGDKNILLNNIEKVFEKKSAVFNIYSDIHEKYFEIYATLIRNDKISFIINDNTDIIDQINKNSERLNIFNNIFNLANDIFLIIERETLNIVLSNKAATSIFNKESYESLTNTNLSILMPENQKNGIKSIDLLKSEISQLDSTDTINLTDWEFKNHSGQTFITNLQVSKINSDKSYISLILSDTSKIEELKANYEKSQTWLQTIIDSVLSVIVVKDINGKVIACNESYKKTFGYKSSNLIGKHNEDIYVEEEALAIRNIDQEIIELGIERTYEQQLYTADKTKHIFLVTKNPLKDNNGNVYAIVSSGTDISVIKTLENKLYKAQLEAVIANNAKSQFLANMSHEIRTPINAIIGYSDLLKKKNQDERTKEYVNSISQSSRSLLGLINQVLDLSKIEAGKIELNNETADVYNILESIIEIFQLKAKQKNINLSIEYVSRPEIYFSLDIQKLKQIIINLLGNALKFTDEGFIKIVFNYETVNAEYGNIELKIIDSGIGVSEEDKKKLFKPFTQIDSDNNRRAEGTGLGLNISRQLAEIMNGEIKLESTLGKGSTFTLNLYNIETARDFNRSSQTNENIDYQFNACKLLVIDDIYDNRRIIADLLIDYGFEVIQAENGKDGLNKAIQEKPEIILLDLVLPDLNGWDVCKTIREKLPNINQVILAYTAVDSLNNINDYDKKAFNGQLIKPINRSILLSELSKHIKHKKINYKEETSDQTYQFNNNIKAFISKLLKNHPITTNEIHTNREIKELIAQIQNSKEYSKDDTLKQFILDLVNALDDFNVEKTDYLIKFLINLTNE